MLLDTPKCSWILQNAPGYSKMLLMLPNAPEYSHMLLDTPKCSWILQNAPGCSQIPCIFPNAPEQPE
jgi:hypothetical protein